MSKRILDLIRFWKGTPEQQEALAWLEGELSEEQLDTFAARYRQSPQVTENSQVNGPQHCYLRLSWTEKYHSSGFRIFSLDLMNKGKAVDKVAVLSGAGVTQQEAFCHPADDYSGSLRCLPEGIYAIGEPADSLTEGRLVWDDAVGRWWASIDAVDSSQVNNRSAFGFHIDANASYSKGSAGCVCPFDDKKIETIMGWLRQKAKPTELVCDLGMRFIPEKYRL